MIRVEASAVAGRFGLASTATDEQVAARIEQLAALADTPRLLDELRDPQPQVRASGPAEPTLAELARRAPMPSLMRV